MKKKVKRWKEVWFSLGLITLYCLDSPKTFYEFNQYLKEKSHTIHKEYLPQLKSNMPIEFFCLFEINAFIWLECSSFFRGARKICNGFTRENSIFFNKINSISWIFIFLILENNIENIEELEKLQKMNKTLLLSEEKIE